MSVKMDKFSMAATGIQRKSKGHKCYMCGQRFMNVHVLRKHVNVHKDRDIECDICGKAYSSLCGLKKHKLLHTGERPFSCDSCDKAFRQKCTLLSHVQSVHNGSRPKYFCVTCGKKVKSGEYLQCWFCKYEGRPVGAKSPCLTEFWQPAKNDVPGEEESCSTSLDIDLTNDAGGNSLLHKDDDSSMIDLQSNPNAIGSPTVVKLVKKPKDPANVEMRAATCLMCSETFPSLIELRQHITDVHKSSRPFMCDICGARFATQMALNNHLPTHEEERPFMCLTCGKCFKTQVALQTHLNTHREDRPYSCKICKASFKTVLSLKTHSVIHTTERPFICKECGYPFKTMDRLKKHIIVHTDERPYKCETCFKEFKHAGNLGRHYYLHIGQRLFICRICGKDFAQSGGLKQHEQVHDKHYEENKKLTCPFCNKAYKLDVMLQRHLITHQ